MGVSHRRRHRVAVPPRSVIGSPSQVKIGSMESRLPRSEKWNRAQWHHGYSQAISEAGHVQNSIHKLTDVTVTWIVWLAEIWEGFWECPPKICVTNEREVWSVKHDEGEVYGSKSVPSDFENKKPLNSKHWICMHWNEVSGFFASEFNSINHIQLYFSILKNSKSNIQR